MYGFVYIWFDVKRSMFYIGSHWGTEADGYVYSSTRMLNAYKRRPKDFKRRILTKVSSNRNDLLDEEYRWLSLIGDHELGKRYYNLTKYKNGHWTTDEKKGQRVREKIGKAQLGKRLTSEWKQKISESMKGKNVGKSFSIEHREKLSKAKIGKPSNGGMRGKHTEETKAKMSAAQLARYKREVR